MLEKSESMFDNMLDMMKKLKKTSYKTNMKGFIKDYGHFFDEMTEYVKNSSDQEIAAQEVANIFVKTVISTYSIKGKLKAHMEANLNLFMIYYVFPAILLTEKKSKSVVADTIRDVWRIETKNKKFQYADYDKIYNSFREKIFGIF